MKVAATLAFLLLLIACTSTPTTGPRATVQMRDGTRVSGMVLSSTAAELKIVGDDNVARTIPMSLVRSVTYGEPAAAAPAATVPAAPPRSAAAPARPAAVPSAPAPAPSTSAVAPAPAATVAPATTASTPTPQAPPVP